MSGVPVTLLDEHKVPVDAWRHEEITEKDLTDWEANWRPVISDLVRGPRGANNPLLQSRYWDWRRKVKNHTTLADRGFTVVCQGKLQGMMLVTIGLGHRCHLPGQQDKDQVYIEYLESAPWNQRVIQDPPKYWGVGTALIRGAIDLSIQEGFKGRIGLLSLPQARDFYKQLGMIELASDADDKQLSYFEMSEKVAQMLLSHGLPGGGARK